MLFPINSIFPITICIISKMLKLIKSKDNYIIKFYVTKVDKKSKS